MPYYPIEAFCRVEYPSELTYEALMEYEADLIPHIEQVLSVYGAVHVDVFPDGDELRVQCAFAELDDIAFEAMAIDMAEAFGKCSEARMLALSKNLREARLARFMGGRARVERLQIP